MLFSREQLHVQDTMGTDNYNIDNHVIILKSNKKFIFYLYFNSYSYSVKIGTLIWQYFLKL